MFECLNGRTSHSLDDKLNFSHFILSLSSLYTTYLENAEAKEEEEEQSVQ